jgi:predicted DNA-binding protein YlxM (UPF0122 family)
MGMDVALKYPGVGFDRRRNKWMARFKINGKTEFLGYFDNFHDAVVKRKDRENFSDAIVRNEIKDNYKKEIGRLYLEENLPISEIALKFNKNYWTIYEHLQNMMITIRDDRLVQRVYDENEVVSLYDNDNYSIKEIADFFEIGYSEVYYVLNKKGVNLRPNRKYLLHDVNVFNSINEDWKAYFLGLFAADGCLYQNNYGYDVLNIGLHFKDSYVLSSLGRKIFQDFLELHDRNGNVDILRICSKQISEMFRLMGFTERKSLTVEMIPVEFLSEQFYSSFFRGYFDGDGCVTGRNNWEIISSESFIDFWKNYFEQKYGMTLYKRKAGKVFRLQSHRKDNFLKLFQFMYPDQANLGEFYLRRKFDGFCKRLNL